MIVIKRCCDTNFYPNTGRFDVLGSNRFDQIIGIWCHFQPQFGYDAVRIFALKKLKYSKKIFYKTLTNITI